MIVAYIVLMGVMIFCPLIKFGANEGYISSQNTLPIKGFWVMVVFFCHYSSYIELSQHTLNYLFLWLNSQIGQLCVVMFLFYSGYGIWCSYCVKPNYIKTFLWNRIFLVWLNFAICLLFFLIENLFLGIKYDLIEIFLSFTGLASIGNSNWYMFVTFALYIIFFLSFKMFGNKDKEFGLTVFTTFCFVLVVVLYLTKEPYWYNTLLCFPAGMWYATLKNKINDFSFKSIANYLLLLSLSFSFLVITYLLQRWHGIFFIIYAISFCVFTVVVTMKLTVNSKLLSFLGKHVFSIYIFQRLFFNLGQYYGLNKMSYLYFILCLAGTIIFAIIYDCSFEKIRQRLIK